MSENKENDSYTGDEIKEYQQAEGLRNTLQKQEQDVAERKRLKKNVTWLTIACVLMSGCLLVLIAAFLSFPKQEYIEVKDNTQLCKVSPEKNPNLSDQNVSNYIREAITRLNSIDYVNFESQQNSVLAKYFTPEGRISAIKSSTKAGTIDYITKNALTLKAYALGAPTIERRGVDGDITFWEVTFPMGVDVYSGTLTPISTTKQKVTVRVQTRTPTPLDLRGLGISFVDYKTIN